MGEMKTKRIGDFDYEVFMLDYDFIFIMVLLFLFGLLDSSFYGLWFVSFFLKFFQTLIQFQTITTLGSPT